jgi:diketogulonate reductase-like aldo/keto reductase
MKHRPFHAGIALPRIGQGTWNLERAERRRAIDALRRGVDAGMTHVDTAEMYGDGRVEEIVGEAIADLRDRVFLVSKVLPQNASLAGTVRACEASLRRLGTDRLDCYLLHWAGPHPIEDTVAAFERLAADGKILSWGVSNFDEDELDEVVGVAGAERVACNQVLYHLAERAIEHAVVPYCREHGIAVVGYSPFGGSDASFDDLPGVGVLEEVGRAHGATARQVALAFLVRGEGSFAIPKSARAEHTIANARAGEIELSEAEVARIDAAFPRGRRRRGVPTL